MICHLMGLSSISCIFYNNVFLVYYCVCIMYFFVYFPIFLFLNYFSLYIVYVCPVYTYI